MLNLLVILVVTIACSIGLARAMVRVARAREALLVCNRLTGSVSSVVVGPSFAPVLPVLEEVRKIDLGLQLTGFYAANVVTLDRLLVSTNLDLTWSIDPALLRQTDVNQILPFLDDLAAPVRTAANYVVRSVLGQYRMDVLLQVRRTQNGLERLLRRRLQESVAALGVRVHLVRLICQPEATMLNARIMAEARAQEVVALASVLGPQAQIESILRLEMIEALRRSNSQFVTAFEIPESQPHDGSSGHGRVQFIVGPR